MPQSIHRVYLSFRYSATSDNGNLKKLNFELRRSRQQLLRKTLSRNDVVGRIVALKFTFYGSKVSPSIETVGRNHFVRGGSMFLSSYSIFSANLVAMFHFRKMRSVIQLCSIITEIELN